MKIRGHIRQIATKEGGKPVWSDLPTNRADALAEGVSQYQPHPYEMCPACKHSHTIYTLTGRRSCCADKSANVAWAANQRIGGPVNASEAMERGLDYYFRAAKGTYCGHIGKRTLQDKCYQCEYERAAAVEVSPRQVALAAGERWYTPVDGSLCSAGHFARRRVINGSCEQCEIERGARVAGDREPALQDICPDLIISRADALAAGFKVYRTGAACRAGHVGWRYVSTGACLACMGR